MKENPIKKLLKVIGVWMALLLLLYVFLEATFFYYFTWVFPLSAYSYAGPGAGIALQYSKKNIYPEKYIAILGDSYAFGQGDWQLEGEHAIRPVYSAAHILHQKLNRDVVTFGFPASDSIRSNNILPNSFLDATKKSGLKTIEDPDTIIVYFYEGNDLNDNVEMAEKSIYPLLENKNDIYDVENFQEFIIPSLVKNSDLTRQLKNISWTDRLFFLNFTKNIMLDSYQKYRSGSSRAPWKPPKKGNTTQVSVNGVIDYLQDNIQSPALSLDTTQIQLGLYVFDQSLIALQKKFPDAKIGIAYVPAVITAYEVVSPEIHDYYKDPRNSRERIQSSVSIRKNSDAICQQVRDIALRRNAGFVDSRSRLRSVAKNYYIHGPIDWNHFNRLGYETFSEDLIVLLQQLEQFPQIDLPACRWEISS